MIYLRPEVRSGLGEDTFWTWFAREVAGCSFNWPPPPDEGHVALVYSTMEPAPGCRNICLAWELYPEMRKQLGGTEWDQKVEQTYRCAEACGEVVVTSPIMLEFYPGAKVIPIGIDMALFHDQGRKSDTAFWCGTPHKMKGRDRVDAYRGRKYTVSKLFPFPQEELAARMRACKTFLATSRLRPWYLVELEAMACGCEPIWLDNMELDKCFLPGPEPRKKLLELGYDRPAVKREWEKLLWP